MQTVIITGGTGLVGSALCHHLVSNGFKIIILTRSPHDQKDIKGVSYAAWDIKSQTIDLKAIQDADYIIHLAGAGVMDKKWTAEYKKEIINSRVLSSRLLVDTLKKNPNKVKGIVSASAIGFYGSDKLKGHYFKESEPASNDFLGQTCLKWEQSIEAAGNVQIPVCKLRTGIVLTDVGGALDEFKKPLRFGVAAILGNGKQVISWIHILDLCSMYHHAMINHLVGSYNATAPLPVTNKKLMLTLAKLMRGNFFIPVHVPVFILKLMLGGRSVEILKSTTVCADKIKATGFTFLYPSVEEALEEVLMKKTNKT